MYIHVQLCCHIFLIEIFGKLHNYFALNETPIIQKPFYLKEMVFNELCGLHCSFGLSNTVGYAEKVLQLIPSQYNVMFVRIY